MKTISFLSLVACTIGGCRIDIGDCRLPPPSYTCRFSADKVSNARNIPISDEGLDSARSYTYFTNAVRMDSLLPTLCEAGIRVDTAYFVTVYLCKDTRGPRPVVVLAVADGSMLNRGFTAGATGRLACASQLVLYTPAK